MQKILIINSNYETMRLLKAWLERKFYDVKITADLSSIVDMIRKFRPELLLIDIDQASVIAEIKSHTDMQSIPILLITGLATNIQGMARIADDTIEKPFNLELLQKKVGGLINVST